MNISLQCSQAYPLEVPLPYLSFFFVLAQDKSLILQLRLVWNSLCSSVWMTLPMMFLSLGHMFKLPIFQISEGQISGHNTGGMGWGKSLLCRSLSSGLREHSIQHQHHLLQRPHDQGPAAKRNKDNDPAAGKLWYPGLTALQSPGSPHLGLQDNRLHSIIQEPGLRYGVALGTETQGLNLLETLDGEGIEATDLNPDLGFDHLRAAELILWG